MNNFGFWLIMIIFLYWFKTMKKTPLPQRVDMLADPEALIVLRPDTLL